MKEKLYQIIFRADTKEGKTFDILLIILILISIAAVIAESVPSLRDYYGNVFLYIEFIISAIFIIEYIVRIFIVAKPSKYIFSFYGIVDFLAILPVLLVLFLGGGASLVVLRSIRLVRIFRIFKLSRYSKAGNVLAKALRASSAKISVFLIGVCLLIIMLGTLMYLVEGEQNGFTSIPKSIYWAVVTITTVGYGDMAPSTGLGQFIASITMLIGYGVIAVPTGIVSAEVGYQKNVKLKSSKDIKYCKYCGEKV